MSDSTLLSMNGLHLPPYSARGLTQSFKLINGASAQRRTVNGRLRDISDSLFQKYASSIKGSDQQPPAFDGIFPGAVLVVDCLFELSTFGTVSATTDATTELAEDFGRPAVPGSVRHEGGYTFYRPRMTMMVVDFDMDADEWAAGVDWTLQLEEV